MKKLAYSIYSNITDKEYLELKNKLTPLAVKMLNDIAPLGWILNANGKNNDALIIDFVIFEDGYYGNLGIIFNENAQEHLFSFYITKTFDRNGMRYFMKKRVFTDKKIGFFYNSIHINLKEALNIYYQWTDNDIEEFGESFKL